MFRSTPITQISSLVAAQRAFFRAGKSLDYAFRRQMLDRLEAALRKWEQPLCEALASDLHKSYEEAYMTEIGLVLGEIATHRRRLKRWMRPERCATPLRLFPSRSRVIREPLGVALIIAPWNYPVQLLLNPLVGAISAGCTALLKPSPYVPNVSRVVEELIRETFEEAYIGVVQGNREVNTALLAERYDLIFFTGSPKLGRVVMEAASKHLTPVILELGGKSPCIVDRTADVAVAAKRVAWGKTLNAGQTCIAPDYLLIHRAVKEPFVEAYARALRELHGDDPRQSAHLVRMVNEAAFDRVSSYLDEGRVLLGGGTDRADRYIAPTLLDAVSADAAVMQEEIFGPVLPMVEFEALDEALCWITEREKPLALYYFGDPKTGREVLRRSSSGGACINDVVMHIANERLPFGGVGNSGMGAYHGEESFKAFSHRRAVLTTPKHLDLPFRYMPYRLFKWIKRLL